MTEIKAKLSNLRQSPRKVRLVANLIQGKKVERANKELSFLNKKASTSMKKLLQSAMSNAKNNKGLSEDKLTLKSVRVDEGPTLKRFRAGARGRAFPIKKRTSHVSMVLTEEAKSKVKK